MLVDDQAVGCADAAGRAKAATRSHDPQFEAATGAGAGEGAPAPAASARRKSRRRGFRLPGSKRR